MKNYREDKKKKVEEKKEKEEKEKEKKEEKEDIKQMNMNNYNKNVFNDVEHKIERIKKWVKMSKYSTADKNSKIEKNN